MHQFLISPSRGLSTLEARRGSVSESVYKYRDAQNEFAKGTNLINHDMLIILSRAQVGNNLAGR